MPSRSEISEQVTRESARRERLSRPAFAGGVLYLLGGIIISSTEGSRPRVGVFQGLAPAIAGDANPSVSPRAPEVKFVSHHALALIAGGTIVALAIGALTMTLLLLLDATRFRRPQTWSAARPLVLGGGIVLTAAVISQKVVSAIEAHKFAVGHDFSNHAVDQALTSAVPIVVAETLGLLAGVALAAGMIAVALNAMRVGLLTRWMGILGIVAGVLVFVPVAATLEVVPAFWMVAMGMLYAGHWPNGVPPAWAAGEARPWPSQAELRAAKQAAEGRPALAGAGADVAPAPSQPASTSSSRKRRRKRGSR